MLEARIRLPFFTGFGVEGLGEYPSNMMVVRRYVAAVIMLTALLMLPSCLLSLLLLAISLLVV